uniref:Uncharacterized protein n=1 Tax=Capra hircus TaxID=9925 RepID=A0A8C2XV07_CAPHI
MYCSTSVLLSGSLSSGGARRLLASSMAVTASSTDECPCWPTSPRTWIFLCSSCRARSFRETRFRTWSPGWLRRLGTEVVSRVWPRGWMYLRAWKSLCRAWPTTTLPFRSLRICEQRRSQEGPHPDTLSSGPGNPVGGGSVDRGDHDSFSTNAAVLVFWILSLCPSAIQDSRLSPSEPLSGSAQTISKSRPTGLQTP